jgi:hypothetical protein
MSHEVTVFLISLGLFLGMLLFLEIGRRASIRRIKEDGGTAEGRLRLSHWQECRTEVRKT